MLKLILSFLIVSSLLCSETISVIVPCHYKHFKHVEELMDNLNLQSRLPDEVVISLSQSNEIPIHEITKFESLKYPFAIKFIKNEGVLFAGMNRNIACDNAIGDIFITQDADDVPHQQRLEIIEYFFSKYDVDHIIHRWKPTHGYRSDEYFGYLNEKDVEFYFMQRSWDKDIFDYITNGNIAIRREVFEKVRWGNLFIGEDVDFNNHVFEFSRKTIVLNAFLLIYRQELSSYSCSR